MDLVIGTVLLRPYVFGFLVLFLVAAAADLGPRRTLLFGGWVWPLAWLAEFASTRVGVPFGLYHYTGTTRGQELYIGNVPFVDSLSFTFLAYASYCLARLALRGRRASRPVVALLSGGLMMWLDVVIDPLAVRGGRWFLGQIFYYPDGGIYFGVPLSNFAGWAAVGALGVGGYLLCAGEAPPRRAAPGVALYYGVLAFNLVVTAWIGEWSLVAAGVGLHVAATVALHARRPGAGVRLSLGRSGMERA
ncbi:MAG: carotenoid biosynthesis protein [Candidatus Rokubacteria bacterium]|nr:carotenoid biosynthesis protein [Candidatus Rokubacteria bacterium]